MVEGKGRIYSLEILKIIDNICKNNNLKYSLLFDTLVSQDREEGYASWLSNIVIGLLYPEYIQLQQLVEKEKDIYVLSKDNIQDYNVQYSQICMRSKVNLPEGREKDLPYYDYSIWVYPIFYAGNTKKECQEIINKFNFYDECEQATAPIPYARGVKKKIEMHKCKNLLGLKKKEELNTKRFFIEFLENAQKPSKYVFIPSKEFRLKSISCLASTYENVENYNFSGEKVYCIKQKKEWIAEQFSRENIRYMIRTPANVGLIKGPEVIRRVQLVALDILIEFDRICQQHNIPYILFAGTLLGAIRHKGFIPWDDDIDVAILEEDWVRFSKVIEQELDSEKYFLRTQETDKDDNLVFYQIKRNNTVYVKGGRDNFDTHKGIFLDILPFHNSPNNIIDFIIQDKLCHFLKTMTWAHMGYTYEKRPFYKQYYTLLSIISNKKSYKMFYKLANKVKKESPYLSFQSVVRNPYKKGFNQRKFFEERCYVEFEGHYFPAPKDYDESLRHFYGEDYMKLVTPLDRVNKHLPAKIELNGLYEL